MSMSIDNNYDEMDDEMDDLYVDVDYEESDDNVEVNNLEVVFSKHKIKDRHRLCHDSIFNGKKEVINDESIHIIENSGKPYSFEPSMKSNYYFERENPQEYKRLNSLKDNVYEVVTNILKLNVLKLRRKPSKNDFNAYYATVVSNIDMEIYSYSEVFMELSFYFSDNIGNMFKLLDEKWGGKISREMLKKHKGSTSTSSVDLGDIEFV